METQVLALQQTGKPLRYNTVYAWLVCSLGALFFCYEYFLRISPSVMMQDLMRVYHIDAAMLGNLAAFYYYAYTPMQLPVGVLMDRFGPRRLLAFACLLCALGTYLFAESGHLFFAQAGRFMVGFGSAFAFVGVLKLATIWLPPQRFAMIAGMATALGMIGAMIGDVALAELVNSQGWHKTVIFSAGMGIILAVIILLILRDEGGLTKAHSTPAETASFAQLLKGLGQLVKNRQMWLVGLVGCLLYLPTSAFAELWGISFLEKAYNFSTTVAAGAVSMIFLGWAVGGPLIGFISDKAQLRRAPMVIGSILGAAVIAAVLYMPNLSPTVVYCLLFLTGVLSSVENIVFAIGREISPTRLSGTALALTNMLVMMGGVIFQPIIGVVLDWLWDGQMANGVRAYPVYAYKWALLVLPIGFIIASLIAAFLKETHCRVVEES